MDLEQILTVAATAAITAIVSGVIGFIRGKLSEVNKARIERERQIDRVVEAVEKLEHWQKRTEEKLKKIDISMENIINGGTALLRDRILQSCQYFRKMGRIPFSSRENLRKMYDVYHAYGGNGIATRDFKAMMDLPVYDDYSEHVIDINVNLPEDMLV